MKRGLGVAVTIALAASTARADGRLLTEDTFAVTPPSAVVVDSGLVVGLPAALPAGMTSGLGVGVTHACGCHLAYGATASWTSATDASQIWTVTHGELRLRAAGALRRDAGRGTLALRAGLGVDVVHEDRVRNQGMRAGLSGADLETTATTTLPALDVQGIVGMRVVGPWALQLAAGPSVTYFEGHLRGGWTAELGVAWHL